MAIELTADGEWWFHVYNRGVGKQPVFRRAADRRMFLDCFARHLGPEVELDSRGRAYRHLRGEVAVGAYCLMPNHFHLVVRAAGEDALGRLMRSATIAYGKYFNHRYDRGGPMWQGRFRSNDLPSPESVLRATAYVHLNHKDDPDFQWSSHRYLVGEPEPLWLAASQLVEAIGGRPAYERYVAAELIARERRRAKRESSNDSWHDLADP